MRNLRLANGSNQDWAKLQATKEEGGQWSPSRLQRKARNEAMLQAGRSWRSGAVGDGDGSWT